MKLITSLLSLAAFSVVLAATSLASAQAPAKPPTTTTIRTADYTETRMGGDQVVTFPGDELPVSTEGPYGTTIRVPPGVTRALLIRPRFNFVPELLKSVENL